VYKASASIPDPTGFLRFTGAVLLVSSLLVPSAATQAQTGATTHPQVRSVVFQDSTGDSGIDDGNASPSTAVAPQTQVGLGGSLVFQDPKGNYGSDHGNASAFGFSLQIPIRRSKEWTFLPTYTSVSSSPGSNLGHETKSIGLDVHWRGPNPGAGYLLFGGGSATAKLDVKQTTCPIFFIPVGCSQTATTVSSKTAPYLQAGFGLEGEQSSSRLLDGGWFIEARLWRGPYLQPISLASGIPVGSRAKTGNALLVAVGFRFLGPYF